ncbi:MAG: hypothetical protein MPJ50_11740 [Pirellulales bacterium]|nr:hypothetical protein [Pirellulales bacterium]
MPGSLIKLLIWFLVWPAALLGSLTVSQSNDWGYGYCGVWGCGPPIQVLVSLHSAWLIFLAPLVFLVGRSGSFSLRAKWRFGLMLLIVGAATIAGFTLYQKFVWLPSALEWQQPYLWRRCLFVIATATDFPMVQTTLLGAVLMIATCIGKRRTANQLGDDPFTNGEPAGATEV